MATSDLGLPAASPQPPSDDLTATPCLLDLPAAALARTASLLQPPDRARLAACCRALHKLSGGWWGTLQLVLSQERADSVAAWLARKRPVVSVLQLEPKPNIMATMSLPDSAGPSLVDLEVTRMRVVPASLSCITALTRLALKSAMIEIPAPDWMPHCPPLLGPMLGSLTRLQELSLEHLGLKGVPPEVGALPVLRSLVLRWNYELGEGLHHLAGLQYLTFLDLRQGAVGEVVPAFSALTALRRLGLSRNASLSGGLHHLAGLTNLTSLYLSSCNITTLPPAFSTLTALERLDLAGNRALASGLEHLGGMGRLSSLRLGGCSIAALPAAFTALTALQKLELNGNAELASGGGWEHLAGLRGLLRLDLRQCGLEGRLPQRLAGLPSACQVEM